MLAMVVSLKYPNAVVVVQCLVTQEVVVIRRWSYIIPGRSQDELHWAQTEMSSGATQLNVLAFACQLKPGSEKYPQALAKKTHLRKTPYSKVFRE